MRRNDNGSIYTWTVRHKDTGEDVLVDDRTFDAEVHEDPAAPAEEPAGGGKASPKRGKKD